MTATALAFGPLLTRYLVARGHDPRGAELKITCPFHEDSSPSCRVDLEGGVFRCDPCGRGGGALELVEGLERCDRQTAIRVLTGDGPVPPRHVKPAPAPDLRGTLADFRAALRGPGGVSALEWLAREWHVSRAVLDGYGVGLGAKARVHRDVMTNQLAVPSFRARELGGAVELVGIKLYRPTWRELGGDPDYKCISVTGSHPALVGGHLLGDAQGRTVLVVGGEKDALVAAAALPDLVVVAHAGGEGSWKNAKAQPLAAEIVAAKPAQIVVALDADEAERGTPQAVDAFARAGGSASPVSWPAAFGTKYPKGGTAQFLMDPAFGPVAFRALVEAATPTQESTPMDAKPATLDLLKNAGVDALVQGAPLADVESALRRLAPSIHAIGKLDPLRAVTIRASALEALQKCKVPRPVELMNAAIAGARQADAKASPDADTASGSALAFVDPEPWPEAVDLAAVLDHLVATFKRFLVVQGPAYEAMALWVAHTYCADAFEHTPRLAFESPQKRCGKSRGLKLLGVAVARPLMASNITSSALFRAVEAFRPTLLVDEADSFLADNEELRGVLNAGFEPDGAVIRTVGEDHEPRRFRAFAPAALAAIGKLPDTLEDRSIVLEMKRRTTTEPVERLRRKRLEAALGETRRKLARFAADARAALTDADPELPKDLDDRAADAWRPLVALADAAGGEWPKRARAAAAALSGGRDTAGGSLPVLLLADLRGIFATRGVDKLPSTEIVADLLALEERPWRELRQGSETKPITPSRLSHLLKTFQVLSRSVRVGDKTPKGYSLESLQDAFARYLRSPVAAEPGSDFQAATPQQTSNDAASELFPSRNTADSVAASNRDKPNGQEDCCVVAAPDPSDQGFVADPDEPGAGASWEH